MFKESETPIDLNTLLDFFFAFLRFSKSLTSFKKVM